MTIKCPKCRCYVDAVKTMFGHECPHCRDILQPAPDPDGGDDPGGDTELDSEVC